MTTIDNDFFTKNGTIKTCKICNTKCSRNSEWERHLLTRKHKNNVQNGEKTTENNAKRYICHCKKLYNDRAGLWRHKQKCSKKNNGEISPNVNILDKETVLCLLQQNKEFKDVIVEQSKQIMELAKNGNYITNNNINNTTNNQNFNLNFFLNEQCKEALDIMDFIGSLQLNLTDLENTGKVGYVKGISDIFLRNLKELDVYKRPIHCSDLKREVMYIKDNDTWEKDEDNKKVKKAIMHIGGKNFKQVKEWVEKNPDSKDVKTKKHEQYVQILTKCTGGIDNEEDEKLYKKIIANVAKEVQIEK
jgi:hypothetical protein